MNLFKIRLSLQKRQVMFERSYVQLLVDRMSEPRKRIQVVMGPRQVGKTTIINQFEKRFQGKVHYYSADNVTRGGEWIVDRWEDARMMVSREPGTDHILVIDEVQKIEGWSESVKAEWDLDTRRAEMSGAPALKVILLGSSRLLLQKGLKESLLNRFETIHVPFWTYGEMYEAFGYTMDEYLYFGGMPGVADERRDALRWRSIMENSIIEPMLSKDVLHDGQVRNPVLLRDVFMVGSAYSSEIRSVSALQRTIDGGTNPTIASYLNVLDEAMALKPIYKYHGNMISEEISSSPKMQVYDNAYMSIAKRVSFDEMEANPEIRGRFVESAVGAYLANKSVSERFELFYWRDHVRLPGLGSKIAEVDFILRSGRRAVAIEVKSRRSENTLGLQAIRGIFPEVERVLTVGPYDFPLEKFFGMSPMELFDGQALRQPLCDVDSQNEGWTVHEEDIALMQSFGIPARCIASLRDSGRALVDGKIHAVAQSSAAGGPMSAPRLRAYFGIRVDVRTGRLVATNPYSDAVVAELGKFLRSGHVKDFRVLKREYESLGFGPSQTPAAQKKR